MSRPWRKPRITPDEVKFAEFAGVVNTRSRKDLGLKALFVGDNVLVSDTGKIVRREGYSLYYPGNVRTAFGLGDALYVVDGDTLLRVISATETRTLGSGFTGAQFSWEVVNGAAYFVDGVAAGVVRDDELQPWRLSSPVIAAVTAVDTAPAPATPFALGATYTDALWRFCATYETLDGRETAPSELVEIRASPLTRLFRVEVPRGYARTNVFVSEPDGTVYRLVGSTTTLDAITVAPSQGTRELLTLNDDGMPPGIEQIAFFEGRMYGAQYLPTLDQTVVWRSEPLAFHLWNQSEDFFLLPGRVALMRWIRKTLHANMKSWLLVGSTQGVWVQSEDGGLERLADYGVVPGQAGDVDAEGTAYFWTTHGFCKAFPFENLTEANVSMPPGLSATAQIIYRNGMQQLVVVTQGGGSPFNQRTERT